MPTKFTWLKKERAWKPRKRGKAIGRIAHVTPSQDELYYLRILLNYVKGPLSYDDIKTVNGVTYGRFVDACEVLGLLDDDKEYIRAIKDASEFSTGSYLRKLFCRMLNGDCLTQPEIVWEQCWEYITEDILFNHRKEHNDFGINLSVDQIKNIALTHIEQYLKCRGKTLDKWTNMPKSYNFMEYNGNRLIDKERNYNQEDQRREQARVLGMITDEQCCVYDEIMNSVVEKKGGVFFLYGFGGTGKTFIWNTLSASVQGMGKIVINTASSGIAALLLPGGRTAHSRFAIPINPDESTSCKIDPGTDLAGLMVEADLIIWDEAPMMSRHCFENLDRALRDIVRSNDDKPFGGKVVVFGGDFRQILPVIPGSGRTETVLASLNSSYIWNSCKVLKLTKNMRLLGGLSIEDVAELKEFSDWILAIGDGEINNPNTGVVEIDIPEDLLIKECGDPIHTIVKEVYGDSFDGSCNADFFKTKAILSPTNDDVDQINAYMLSKIPGEKQVILSSDSISPTDRDPKNVVDYQMEFLNSIKVSGLPKHELKIKKGAPIMCLCNIDPTDGLCNGTRLIVTQSTPHVIEAVIITGSEKQIGEKVLIPRMFVSPPDGRFSFRMRRRQFPITLAFAITINKSHGQSLETVGLFLPKPVFSHGELYVALSRVKSRSGLKILITDEKGNVQKKTTNVVYKEVFEKI